MRGLALWKRLQGARAISTRSILLDEAPGASDLAAVEKASAKLKRKKPKKLLKFGLDESNAGELQRVHSARREIDKWLEHPTFFNMIAKDDVSLRPDEKKEKPRSTPIGKGPVLTWETCIVFPYDGTSWHPLNRKVKLKVRVSDFRLKPMQRRRLLDLVDRRYEPAFDELTITCDRFEKREDNRKEALRLLYALLEEATNPIAAVLANSGGPGETEGEDASSDQSKEETSPNDPA
ncbi:uncharacterized protein LOC9662925 [Selaginella moellendorffii]|uniref:uncharacterized protein LOC9662925 n=1 Tax=Selaginella moellendorffii TaxID=88036 RepID=UPI000D1C5A57|nr:uncharacterized protein LOC9662925 [Selaginella moellendorffii]|eukprot:XP_002960193.2 uncharacterized protein LOC9662925 [Selaginella moellendorffii]